LVKEKQVQTVFKRRVKGEMMGFPSGEDVLLNPRGPSGRETEFRNTFCTGKVGRERQNFGQSTCEGKVLRRGGTLKRSKVPTITGP